MIGIISSTQDIASMTIKEELLKLKNWKERDKFEDVSTYAFDNFLLITISSLHIFSENIDAKIREETGVEFECLVFISKHKSQTNMRTLTVHPIGNFSSALMGGTPKKLVLTSPQLMTSALRVLSMESKGLDYSVSFESTHHGPLLTTPTFYIEVGSDEGTWKDKSACNAIAKTVLEIEDTKYPVAIGVGGGHYSPRITDVALSKKIAFGHILPTYAIKEASEDTIQEMITATPGTTMAYFHRSAITGEEYGKIVKWLDKYGVSEVKKDNLSNI